jgi:hypothetical protein
MMSFKLRSQHYNFFILNALIGGFKCFQNILGSVVHIFITNDGCAARWALEQWIENNFLSINLQPGFMIFNRVGPATFRMHREQHKRPA